MMNAQGTQPVWRRGAGLRDRLLILVYTILRFRPGAWRLLAGLTASRNWCLRLRTPRGAARLVFDPSETAELTVVDEILFSELYVLSARADVFIDCGAFRGISTIYLQDQAQAARVLAFEPQHENFTALKTRLSLRRMAAECHQAALGDTEKPVCFAGSGVGGRVAGDGEEVRQLRLADFLNTGSTTSLLLKMDVEGAERELLPDLLPLLPSRCTILLETHFDETVSDGLLEPYRQAGFAVYVRRKRRDPSCPVVFIDWELCRDAVA